MVTVNAAYSEPINPSGATPVLTREQIWKGLQRKVVKAQDFVPPIHATDVVEEKENEIIREAHFKPHLGFPARTVREVCKIYAPSKVDFIQPDGTVFSNILSDGPTLADHDYVLTYNFEYRYPDLQAGSEEYKSKHKEHVAGAKQAVHSTIEALRKMGSAGELD